MNNHEKVMTALRGGRADKAPFTVYEVMIQMCAKERELRNRGLCIVNRTPSYRIVYPNTSIREIRTEDPNGRQIVETHYETTAGKLCSIKDDVGYTSWYIRHPFQSPEDYKALRAFIQDAEIVPCYDKVADSVNLLGEDFVVRDQIAYEPLQHIIVHFMGTETFCYEWMDNRDEVISLYKCLNDLNRKIYPVIADGPLEFANYGGNVTPQIIGREVFAEYYMPCYNEAAEILHKKDKLIGCHFDADNTTIMDLIGQSDLDYIEAYDPSMGPSLSEARRAFGNKTIWINFPCSAHLLPPDEIRRLTINLIKEAGRLEGFLIGITEDVPADRWAINYSAIMDGIDDA